MINCNILGASYPDYFSLFKALKDNEDKIIMLKKANEYKSFEKDQLAFCELIQKDTEIKANFTIKDNFIYPVINTTNYMDSHSDVHFPSIWTKSISEQKGKIFYVSNHQLNIDNVIAWPKDVNVFTSSVPWSMVGKNYFGNTEALIFEIPKKAIQKESVIKAIENKMPVTGSVRMQYVKIFMAINSNEKDYIDNKRIWDQRINDIANKEKANENGYFFAVDEAKIIKEGSLELNPSNDATQMIYEPSKSTLETNEPPIKALEETINLNKILFNLNF